MISEGAKYYLACLHSFQSLQRKHGPQQDVKLSALIWLCDALGYAAEKGQVTDLQRAWERYFVVAERVETETEATSKVLSIVKHIG